MDVQIINAVATILVTACWPIYLALFLRRRARTDSTSSRDWASIAGILLQFSAVAMVWIDRRPLFSSLMGNDSLAVAGPAAAAIAGCSVYFSYRALQALGPHWSFVAAVGPDHVLVQHGPYRVVRHPLYACFFGLTFATAMTWSTAFVIPVAMAIFAAGVWIRIRVEERLLRDRFGPDFSRYSREVPALLPLRIR